MGERKTDQWVQFICFRTRLTIGEELFQETWIPLAKALQARGINSVVLSQKVNAKDDSNDFVLISKIWWDAIKAIQGAFPDGLHAASLSRPRVNISTAQVQYTDTCLINIFLYIFSINGRTLDCIVMCCTVYIHFLKMCHVAYFKAPWLQFRFWN